MISDHQGIKKVTQKIWQLLPSAPSDRPRQISNDDPMFITGVSISHHVVQYILEQKRNINNNQGTVAASALLAVIT